MATFHHYSFVNDLAAAWPYERWKEHRAMIAISGGADSVALAIAMHSIAQRDTGKLHLAHFNHRWRGDESDADEAFVKHLADQLQLELHTGVAVKKPDPTHRGQGAESIARDSRYDYLIDTARQIGARYIVTAHTSDDQVETVLHRILRGTGIAGLQGIPRFRAIDESVTLVRPLLEISRVDVLNFLKELNQNYRVDSSNADTQYTRNKIRLEVLPYLKQHFGEQVSENLLKLSIQADAVQQLIDEQVRQLVQQSVELTAGSATIRIDDVRSQPVHLIRELCKHIWQRQQWPLRDMTFDHWDELAELTRHRDCAEFKKDFPGSVVVQKLDNQLYLSRKS